MRGVWKTVYYCDFCGTRRFQRAAMERHETHCTANPDRSCRWRIDGVRHPWVDLEKILHLLPSHALEDHTIEWLREETHGCPACMLAALRQSQLVWYHQVWRYADEVEEFRKRERDRAHEDEMEQEIASLQRAWW